VRVADGKQQRREAAGGLRLEIGAGFDEHGGGGGVAFGGRPHQRRLPAVWLDGVHFGAARQQQPDGVRLP
jgi:hypothetical protein